MAERSQPELVGIGLEGDAFGAARIAQSRIGAVPYLNARPLLWGIEGRVIFKEPADLSVMFANGELDVALLPIFDVLAGDGGSIVDDAAIACSGRVYSVVLAYRRELSGIEKVVLDPGSRTSNHLARCLFAEHYQIDPEIVAVDAEGAAARVLIGDRAIAFRSDNPGWRFLDLGQAWWKWTGLPFVFACWRIHDSLPDPESMARAMREVKESGIRARGRIAAGCKDPVFALKYLSRFIRYDMGPGEKEAIACFSQLLRKHGFLTEREPQLRFL